ncbi:MAG: electron transport complex subunit RsxC [Candidatus Euphemobacter frigidus]|nr:electron transport complex subunit RsxC [Candidatus Euphemobacter frigidus]MDP8274979.1 electron transport complex subunit RsxC [Candidatus Euphemobacter frigidus]
MSRLPTFKGGIHLPEYKELTEREKIKKLPLPPRVVIPLNQNVGSPPRPVVEVGRPVKAGEVIAEPEGPVSSTLHASVSGVVTALDLFPYPAGPDSLAIEIETDQNDSSPELIPSISDPSRLSPDEIRRKVLEAGVVGLGGAGFPAQVKLDPPEGSRIEYAVINGVECEPFLTVDNRLMLEETGKLLAGLRIIMRATGAREGIIAIEANKMDAFYKVQAVVHKEKDIRVRLLKVKYPQGAEKQLIYSLFHREVPAGGLPSSVGCVVQNVGTAIAIAEAVLSGRPLIDRVVTVTGPEIKDPGNFRVRIGTPFQYLLEAAGGLPDGEIKIISGGPMMGIAQATLNAPVIKGTSGLLVMRPVSRERNLPCIRCGECLRVCPIGLIPSDLGTMADKERWDDFEGLGAENCIECGCCAYVCAAGRDLVQLIKLGKAALASRKVQK